MRLYFGFTVLSRPRFPLQEEPAPTSVITSCWTHASPVPIRTAGTGTKQKRKTQVWSEVCKRTAICGHLPLGMADAAESASTARPQRHGALHRDSEHPYHHTDQEALPCGWPRDCTTVLQCRWETWPILKPECIKSGLFLPIKCFVMILPSSPARKEAEISVDVRTTASSSCNILTKNSILLTITNLTSSPLQALC